MPDRVRLRATIVLDYEATPGGNGYDGETDPRRMAAIDEQNDPVDLLVFCGRRDAVTMTIEPVHEP